MVKMKVTGIEWIVAIHHQASFEYNSKGLAKCVPVVYGTTSAKRSEVEVGPVSKSFIVRCLRKEEIVKRQ